MKLQLIHSGPMAVNQLWDNFIAGFSLAALGFVVGYLVIGQ